MYYATPTPSDLLYLYPNPLYLSVSTYASSILMQYTPTPSVDGLWSVEYIPMGNSEPIQPVNAVQIWRRISSNGSLLNYQRNCYNNTWGAFYQI